ncbi:unnamed protein product [Rotaria socialis]|uniref:Calpain catalytic domain-containing protein n=1 Tax=Rotaria socialis TaxID=392032 RepID=A0A818AR73_9BILA|nr:unnamed protein product [Rotaria socialis]
MCDIRPYKNQDYEALKSKHNSKDLFVDPEFPATSKSIYHSGKRLTDVQWHRPTTVFRKAQFVIDGFQRGDLDQGEIGNCWFIAGSGAVTLNPDLLQRVVPSNQSFDSAAYAGIFHFRFWLYGYWYDVVIDDQLPFHSDGRLVFCRNKKDKNEMWAPLLEKAYAKICGSYEAMEGGFTTDALIDMTGGIEEAFELNNASTANAEFKERVKRVLWQAYLRKSMLGCSITADPNVTEARLSNGLVKGHAYSITRVADVTTSSGPVTLVRCLNPWGNETEWNGKYSDNSNAWNEISDEEEEELGVNAINDGEFWMSVDDFFSNFHQLHICHRGPASLGTTEDDAGSCTWTNLFRDDKLTWKEEMFHGEWVPGSTAGGCGQPNKENYWINPQYLVRLSMIDDDDDENLCTMIVALMQKETRQRRLRGLEGEDYMQFRVFKIKGGVNVQDNIEQGNLKFYMNQLERVGASGSYINRREVTKRFRVPPGDYIIIPSTYDADKPGKFLLRMFTEKQADQAQLDQDKEDLTEADVFFQDENIDVLFGEWSSLFGGDEEEVAPPKPINPDIGGVFPSPRPDLPSNFDGGDINDNEMYPQKRFCSIM